MHVEMIRSGRDRAFLEDDLVGLDSLDVPEPDDVPNSTELLELPEARRPALHHGRHDGSVGAEHHPVLFEALIHLLHRLRRDHRLELQDDPREGSCLPGLEERSVQDPVVTRTDPGDVVGIDTSIEQPADGVQRGLASTHDHVPGGRVLERAEVADRDAADPVGHLEGTGSVAGTRDAI